MGPGPNYFSADSVRVDERGLRLSVQRRGGLLYCAEIFSLHSFGHGTYEFMVEDVRRLASSVVLGLFVWSDDPEYAHREIDIEASRWGDPDNNDNWQYTVQPYRAPGNMFRFPLNIAGPSMHRFTWRPGQVLFESLIGNRVVQRFQVRRGVPPPGGDVRVHLNLWNMAETLSADGSTEVVVTHFAFRPDVRKMGN